MRNTAANQMLVAAYDQSSSGKLGQDTQENANNTIMDPLSTSPAGCHDESTQN